MCFPYRKLLCPSPGGRSSAVVSINFEHQCESAGRAIRRTTWVVCSCLCGHHIAPKVDRGASVRLRVLLQNRCKEIWGVRVFTVGSLPDLNLRIKRHPYLGMMFLCLKNKVHGRGKSFLIYLTLNKLYYRPYSPICQVLWAESTKMAPIGAKI